MTARSESPTSRPSYVLVIVAFLSVYVIWGSTYLGIKFGIESIPPFIMAGVRFILAGLLLAAVFRPKEPGSVTWANWRAAATVGVLMLVGGNGLVTFSEQFIDSGLAALLIATVPLWLVAFDWIFYRGPRPTPMVVTGLVVGLIGVYVLVGPSGIAGERAHPIGAAIALAGSLFWATGSLYSRRAPLPKSMLTATWMEMIAAGVTMLVIATVLGEWSRFDIQAVTLKSMLAVVYLATFGSIVALTAYLWLLKVSTPARVGTYAYVNPVVAMGLGALFGGEALSARVVVAAAVILAGVVMITLARRRTSATAEVTVPTPARVPPPKRSEAAVHPPEAGRAFTVDQLIGAQRQADRAYLEFLRVSSMSMGLYVLPAGGTDGQSPHSEDEAYYVLSGSAKLRVGDVDHDVSAGSVVYVQRDAPHRFHDITEKLHTLVFFSPAEGSLRAPQGELSETAC